MQVHGVAIHRPLHGRMPFSRDIPGLSLLCNREWGTRIAGVQNCEIQWWSAGIAEGNGPQSAVNVREGITIPPLHIWWLNCLRTRLQNAVDSASSDRQSWKKEAQWPEQGRGSRVAGVVEEELPPVVQQGREINTVAAVIATGEQQQLRCLLNSSWRSAARGREKQGFLHSVQLSSPWAVRMGTRASTPTSQLCSPKWQKMKLARWCLQAVAEKRWRQKHKLSREQAAKGRRPWKGTRPPWVQHHRASRRNRGGRDGKEWRKDRDGRELWKSRVPVRKLSSSLQAFNRHLRIPRNEALPGNPFLQVDYADFRSGYHLLQSVLVSRPCVGIQASS